MGLTLYPEPPLLQEVTFTSSLVNSFNLIIFARLMKRNLLLIIFGLILGFSPNSFAQRFAIVDTELVLAKLPEYAQAQRQLDQLSRTWQGEVEALRSEADALQKAYDAEKVLLTTEMRESRVQEIKKKDEEAKELQRKYFGPEGEVYKKRIALVRPIQDKVYNAIQEVARKKKLDLVFDKASDLITLFNNGRADITDDVLRALDIAVK
jgi:outer membrane protein